MTEREKKKRSRKNEQDDEQSPRMTSVLKLGILITVSTVFFGIGMGVGMFKYFSEDLPSIAKMELEPPNLVTRIFSADSVKLAELFTERRIPVSIDQIPENLSMALIAVEDRKFYTHWGIDVWGIFRALYINQVKGKIAQGGSTITQQLARALFLTPERTYVRKIREAILAWEIERTYTKDEILERYFNQIYFGSGAWGIEEASRTYFGKSVSDLNLEECAVLAGLPNAPSRYSPLINMGYAVERRNWVLSCMVEINYLDKAVADSISLTPIPINPSKRKAWIAPFFVEYVRDKLLNEFSEEDLYRKGLQIYTTLDTRMQKSAEEHLEEHLQTIESGQVGYFRYKTRAQIIGRDSLSVEEATNTDYIQGALLALDVKTGGIRAMVGGRNFWESRFNRTTQALRQPGSSFKPFVYTAAVDNGIPASQLVEDSPISINQADGTIWRPSNYGNKFNGPTTMRDGFKRSINLVAIKTLMTVGAETVIAYARKLGITTYIPPYESIAVGSADVYPIEIIDAYTAFPNLGVKVDPLCITEIRDQNGTLIKNYQPQREEALSPQTAYVVVSMMKDVVDHGTGIGARSRGFKWPAGGKTGTTNDYTDGWFIGYTPELVCGVWVGFDRPKRIMNNGTGSTLAVPIWTEFMKDAHEGLEMHDFEKPAEGLTTRLICKSSGGLATEFCPPEQVYTEIFKVGTEPGENEECFVHKPSIYLH